MRRAIPRQSFTGHLGRQPHREVETKRGDFENWSAIGCGIEELKGHNCLLVTNMPRTRLFVGIVEGNLAQHEGVGNPRLAVRSVHWVSLELKVGKPQTFPVLISTITLPYTCWLPSGARSI
jgi:hypothetical protein